MGQQKNTIISILAIFLIGSLAWAGDTASYVDLGFSPDGTRYMFAQYGIESKTLKPWAELNVVDVPKNNFVPEGRASYLHDAPMIPGQDGSGALYTLLGQNILLTKKNNIDFLRQGQALFIAMENGDSAAQKNKSIEFRDFDSGASYAATLVPYAEGTGPALKSSFYITLERTGKDGTKKKYIVGTPSVKRPLVMDYTIRRVVVAPKDGSLVFVVEMKKQADSGYDTRYMVEALRL